MTKNTLTVSELLNDSTLKGRADYRAAIFAMQKQQNAYSHFVPRKFLDLLGFDEICDVKPGDQVEMNLTVMFSDIRDFTSLSEKMTSQEAFEFINSHLSRMEPPIHRHGGTVDKFVGDGLMAMFPGSADDAVSAAIAMLNALGQWNEVRSKSGRDSIHIGVGLNTGFSTLGIIGNFERMDTTVIGDAVNVASRIEGLTKQYGVSLCISEDTLIALSNQDKHCVRFVDRVHVKGRLRPVSVFEVFDADDEALLENKLAGLDVFERAVAYYHLKEVEKAGALLADYTKIIPGDAVAATYLERCNQYIENGTYEGTCKVYECLDWEDSFYTGHHEIDEQHFGLATRINDLACALREERADELMELFNRLKNDAVVHFEYEEALMRKHHYPFYEEHRHEHQKCVQRLLGFGDELAAAKRDTKYLMFLTNIYLFDWIINHSTNVDKHVTSYILKKQRSN